MRAFLRLCEDKGPSCKNIFFFLLTQASRRYHLSFPWWQLKQSFRGLWWRLIQSKVQTCSQQNKQSQSKNKIHVRSEGRLFFFLRQKRHRIFSCHSKYVHGNNGKRILQFSLQKRTQYIIEIMEDLRSSVFTAKEQNTLSAQGRLFRICTVATS